MPTATRRSQIRPVDGTWTGVQGVGLPEEAGEGQFAL